MRMQVAEIVAGKPSDALSGSSRALPSTRSLGYLSILRLQVCYACICLSPQDRILRDRNYPEADQRILYDEYVAGQKPQQADRDNHMGHRNLPVGNCAGALSHLVIYKSTHGHAV